MLKPSLLTSMLASLSTAGMFFPSVRVGNAGTNKYDKPVDPALKAEIAAWNRDVERRKAEKFKAKLARRAARELA